MTDPNYQPMIFNPAVHTESGGGFYLPLPILQWSELPTWDNKEVEVLHSDGRLLLSQNRGPTTITIQGQLVGYTATPYTSSSSVSREGLLTIKQDMSDALQGQFWLYRYKTQCWKNCVAESAPVFFENRPDLLADYQLSIRCLNPIPFDWSS